MAIRTTCPGCDAAFKLADDLHGQWVRCKACHTVFVVHGYGLAPPLLHGPARVEPPEVIGVEEEPGGQ